MGSEQIPVGARFARSKNMLRRRQTLVRITGIAALIDVIAKGEVKRPILPAKFGLISAPLLIAEPIQRSGIYEDCRWQI
jgi:hypothetical protein